MAKMLMKFCEKCHTRQAVPSKRRRCHEHPFGPRSYWCYGRLTTVRTPKIRYPKSTVGAKVLNDAVSGEAVAADRPKVRVQDVAQKKLEQARKKVSEKTSAMARLAKQLRAWERKATYYARRASMTDAELAADKARREQARATRPKRRGIRIGA